MHIVLGFLAVVGLAVAGIAFLAWRGAHSVIAPGFVAGGLALGIWALRALWRRDSYAAAQFILFCSAMPVLISGLWAFNVPESRAAWAMATIFMVPVIACASYLYREHKRPEVLPNVLRQWVRAEGICELRDRNWSTNFHATTDQFTNRIGAFPSLTMHGMRQDQLRLTDSVRIDRPQHRKPFCSDVERFGRRTDVL